MAYAQTNYNQKIGMTVNGRSPVYTISQTGCFITSFCNLLERFGVAIDPPTIDNKFAAIRAYTDIDDGVYDDVGWGTISALYPDIVVTGIGTGAPPSDNAIVKFVYGSGKTHFCLVQSASQGTIIDSWDGKVKSWTPYYGGPKEWATYNKAGAQAPSVNSGGGMIPDQDNWYARFKDLMFKLRGRDLSREEFQKNFVGIEPFHMVEILSDDDESLQAQHAQEVGQLAIKDKWDQQIYNLQDQLKATNEKLTQVASKADLSAKLQKQVDDLTAKNTALVNQQAADTETGNAFIRFIGRLFNNK